MFGVKKRRIEMEKNQIKSLQSQSFSAACAASFFAAAFDPANPV